ncbi:Plasma membrane proteolipid 3 [Caenorhabditis elegans]|uniref:Plasma membrane proteolipid 3 n=1 Tax=Caenorhabditis elegans TaxID=6239 RepID=O18038_CAEEL|nr:Plasma membrane proteolipid 3 [Caenorhabditis elegans]CAB03297.1 Plasma membrane proteolipid 3 [Caenorhabditis elegans]|eukprot:NP_506970.1 Uncharacterized protein CELE_T06C12.9 [Caenorhabditis elegans]
MEMSDINCGPSEIEVRNPYIETDNDRLVMVLLMLVLPPMAVYFKGRGCTKHVLINIFLYILLVLPAYKHATWFCFVKGRECEAENGFVRVR